MTSSDAVRPIIATGLALDGEPPVEGRVGGPPGGPMAARWWIKEDRFEISAADPDVAQVRSIE
jgi:hypothetical protein